MTGAVAATHGSGWFAAPVPAIVAAADGRISEINELAQALLPTARVGADLAAVTVGWLTDVDRPAEGTVGDRTAPCSSRW